MAEHKRDPLEGMGVPEYLHILREARERTRSFILKQSERDGSEQEDPERTETMKAISTAEENEAGRGLRKQAGSRSSGQRERARSDKQEVTPNRAEEPRSERRQGGNRGINRYSNGGEQGLMRRAEHLEKEKHRRLGDQFWAEVVAAQTPTVQMLPERACTRRSNAYTRVERTAWRQSSFTSK